MVRRLIGFVVAALVMIVLGSIAHSLMVQQAWADAVGMTEGAPGALSIGDRLSWIGSDLIGMETNVPPYGALTTIALLIAFLAAGLLARFTGLRLIVFAVAGAVAIFFLYFMLKSQLGTVGVFGARGTLGLSLQVAAGLIAGLVFAQLTAPREA
jgi:hypothetical protein